MCAYGPALGATEEGVRFRTSSQIDEACISKSNRVSESKITPPVASQGRPELMSTQSCCSVFSLRVILSDGIELWK